MSVLPATHQESGPTEIPSADREVSPLHHPTEHPPMEILEILVLLVSLEPPKAPATSFLGQDQVFQEAEPPMALPQPVTPMAQEPDQAQVGLLEESPTELPQARPRPMVLQAALDPHMELPPPLAELPMVPQGLQARPTESPLLPLVPATALREPLEPMALREPLEHMALREQLQVLPMEQVREAISVEAVLSVEVTRLANMELD